MGREKEERRKEQGPFAYPDAHLIVALGPNDGALPTDAPDWLRET